LHLNSGATNTTEKALPYPYAPEYPSPQFDTIISWLDNRAALFSSSRKGFGRTNLLNGAFRRDYA